MCCVYLSIPLKHLQASNLSRNLEVFQASFWSDGPARHGTTRSRVCFKVSSCRWHFNSSNHLEWEFFEIPPSTHSRIGMYNSSHPSANEYSWLKVPFSRKYIHKWWIFMEFPFWDVSKTHSKWWDKNHHYQYVYHIHYNYRGHSTPTRSFSKPRKNTQVMVFWKGQNTVQLLIPRCWNDLATRKKERNYCMRHLQTSIMKETSEKPAGNLGRFTCLLLIHCSDEPTPGRVPMGFLCFIYTTYTKYMYLYIYIYTYGAYICIYTW